MPLGEITWTRDLLDEIKLRLEKDLDGNGPLPLPRDDLVAEALLRLMVASERRRLESPIAYARMILLNLVRDHIRDLERTQRVLDELAARRHSPTPEGDSTLERGEVVKLLMERAGLSPLQRLVLERLYFGGLETCELARELGKNPGTIERHHGRALEKLSRCAFRMGIDS